VHSKRGKGARNKVQGTRNKERRKKESYLELILKYAILFQSPFEKRGHRGICLGMP
jgi:hypothetical protein